MVRRTRRHGRAPRLTLCPCSPLQSAHLAMVDTLMMAYAVEMVSVEKVVACAQKYSAFFQATDLPYDIEDAVTYWMNKVGGACAGAGRPWGGDGKGPGAQGQVLS